MKIAAVRSGNTLVLSALNIQRGSSTSPSAFSALKADNLTVATSKPVTAIRAKFNIMRWFKKKEKSKKQSQDASDPASSVWSPPPRTDVTAKLTDDILQRIFSLICPHTQDESYETCEQSAVEDSCPLCDLRNLAHCAQVSRKWRKAAANVMYHSIRIDAVHYCDLEDVLAEKRKRKSKLNRNAEPEDTPRARLILLGKTLREFHDTHAQKVQFLKVAYMTRETCKSDLARAVHLTPNLRYVDLPEGIFQDDPSCHTLSQEIQARCPDLRKMSYMSGAERGLQQLASGRLWPNLEVLELAKLKMDATILRQALGALPNLHALKISDMRTFSDQLFQHHERLPAFPAVTELIFNNIPNVTAEGLVTYLSRPETQAALKTLSLTATGVESSTLQTVVATAPNLVTLSIIETVKATFPIGSYVPPLASTSLQILHYELTGGADPDSYFNPAESHYRYLANSLTSNGLPMLQELYVRDPDFPELLLEMALPAPRFATDPDNFSGPRSPSLSPPGKTHHHRLSSNNPFLPKLPPSPAYVGMKQELVVYSKGLDEMEWNFSRVKPANERSKRGCASTPRPISSYGLGDGLASPWNSRGARQSVIVGNGFGGFLSVPAEDGRPVSSGGEKSKRGSAYDMWR